MKAIGTKGELDLTFVRERLGAAEADEPAELMRFTKVEILER